MTAKDLLLTLHAALNRRVARLSCARSLSMYDHKHYRFFSLRPLSPLTPRGFEQKNSWTYRQVSLAIDG